MTKQNNLFTWSSILKIALEHGKNFALANIIAVIKTLIYLPVPLIIPSLINEVLLKQPGFFTKMLSKVLSAYLITPGLIMITAFTLVLTLRVFVEILGVLQGREFKIISKDVVLSMRTKLLLHLNNISMKEYETLGSGKLASFYIKDLDTIDEFIGTTVSQSVIAILALIGVIIVLFLINWKIALFILLFNPLSLILTAKFSKKLKELKTCQNKAFELFQEAFIETIDAIAQIRSDNKESGFIQKLIGKAQQVRDDSIAYEWKTEIVSNFSGMLLFIGVDLYYIFAMTLILVNDFTIGMMIALLQYVFQVQWYMTVLVDMQSKFYAADSALTRINEVMQFETEPEYIETINPFMDRQNITIDINKLSFSYVPQKPILTDITMQIAPNTKVGIVGTSGSGKSTLIQALLGFYPITSGEITINSASIHDVGFKRIRENISTVLQSPVMFNDTIRNNVTQDKNITDEQIWKALEMAQLKPLIESYELKLDTQVGKRGVRFSGGQRQRFAIARMLLCDSKVVILDEATSALDLQTEHDLFKSIHDFLASKTTIVITHRLSTIIDSDIIYVMNNGQIAEQGTHNNLVQLKGIYYSLLTLQQSKDD
ncbi:MAG TPA: ABC transporter ATP-binding protein [Bacteroidetes bacterium]|nr:ABC transporter ATP-binding protein [Bacteroidota bacterium]